MQQLYFVQKGERGRMRMRIWRFPFVSKRSFMGARSGPCRAERRVTRRTTINLSCNWKCTWISKSFPHGFGHSRSEIQYIVVLYTDLSVPQICQYCIIKIQWTNWITTPQMTKYQKPSFAIPKICKLNPPVSASYIWQSDFAVNRLGNSYVAKKSIIKKKILEK